MLPGKDGAHEPGKKDMLYSPVKGNATGKPGIVPIP